MSLNINKWEELDDVSLKLILVYGLLSTTSDHFWYLNPANLCKRKRLKIHKMREIIFLMLRRRSPVLPSTVSHEVLTSSSRVFSNFTFYKGSLVFYFFTLKLVVFIMLQRGKYFRLKYTKYGSFTSIFLHLYIHSVS